LHIIDKYNKLPLLLDPTLDDVPVFRQTEGTLQGIGISANKTCLVQYAFPKSKELALLPTSDKLPVLREPYYTESIRSQWAREWKASPKAPTYVEWTPRCLPSTPDGLWFSAQEPGVPVDLWACSVQETVQSMIMMLSFTPTPRRSDILFYALESALAHEPDFKITHPSTQMTLGEFFVPFFVLARTQEFSVLQRTDNTPSRINRSESLSLRFSSSSGPGKAAVHKMRLFLVWSPILIRPQKCGNRKRNVTHKENMN
jgi:hypothetical protein